MNLSVNNDVIMKRTAPEWEGQRRGSLESLRDPDDADGVPHSGPEVAESSARLRTTRRPTDARARSDLSKT